MKCKDSWKLTGTTIVLEVILLTKKELIQAQNCIWIRTSGQLEYIPNKTNLRKTEKPEIKGLY